MVILVWLIVPVFKIGVWLVYPDWPVRYPSASQIRSCRNLASPRWDRRNVPENDFSSPT